MIKNLNIWYSSFDTRIQYLVYTKWLKWHCNTLFIYLFRARSSARCSNARKIKETAERNSDPLAYFTDLKGASIRYQGPIREEYPSVPSAVNGSKQLTQQLARHSASSRPNRWETDRLFRAPATSTAKHRYAARTNRMNLRGVRIPVEERRMGVTHR